MPENIFSAGAPLIPANKSAGISPVKPLHPKNVPLNIYSAGAPLIPTNKSAGISPVKPVHSKNVYSNLGDLPSDKVPNILPKLPDILAIFLLEAKLIVVVVVSEPLVL